MLTARLLACAAGLLGAIGLSGLAGMQTASAQVVISQFNGNGGLGGDAFDRDFIELFNKGSSPVNLAGWSLQIFGDSGSSTSVSTPDWDVVPLTGIIYPGQYFLVHSTKQRGSLGASVTTLPLPEADAIGPGYGNADLVANNAVALMNTVTPIAQGTCPNGLPALVDFARSGLSNGLCVEVAPATASSGTNPATVIRNDSGCTDTNNNNSDLVGAQSPSPRNSLSNAFVNMTISPASVTTGAGGLVTLTATRGSAASCNPLTVALSSAAADLSSLGLGSAVALADNGLGGDVTAGDGIFSVQFTVPAGRPIARTALPIAVTAGPNALTVASYLWVQPNAPTNDACSAAAVLSLSGGPFSTTVNAASATADALDAGTCNADTEVKFSVWYSFTPTQAGALRIVETGTEDVVYSVHAACGGASLQCAAREESGIPMLAGTTYLIQIGRETGSPQTPIAPYQLTFEYVLPPANDVCSGAASITTFPFSDTFFTPAFQDEAAAINISCDNAANTGARKAAWYSFVAPTNGSLEIFENSQNATNFTVLTGTCVTPVLGTCVDESSSGAIISGLAVGIQYFLLVSMDTAATTIPSLPSEFTVNFIPAPLNDLCSGATNLNSVMFPYTETVRARAASTDASVPTTTGSSSPYNGCGSTLGNRPNGVWYTYTSGPTETGTLRITDNSSQDVFYNVFDGCGGAPIQCYGAFSNDDIYIRIAPSQTYRILVGMQTTTATASGDYLLTFTRHPAPANDEPCAATLVTSSMTETVVAQGANADVDVSCNYTIPAQLTTGYGVWYRFQLPTAQQLRVQNSGDVLVYGLFTGANCSALSETLCRMGSNGALTTDNTAYFNLQANTQYWLLVGKIANSQPIVAYNLSIALTDALGGCCTSSGCAITTQSACSGRFRGAFTTCATLPNIEETASAVIPDATAGAGGVPGTLTRTLVATGPGTVTDLKVLVDISHARTGDLIITLQSPTGATMDLIRRIDDDDDTVCPAFGGQGRLTDLGASYVFDDQAYTPEGPGFAAAAKYFDFTGLVVPAGNYRTSLCDGTSPSINSAFNGATIAGTWTLTITDNQSSSTGTLNRWGLLFNGGSVTPCPCPADFNGNGSTDVPDIFAFLAAWFANDPRADFDGVGGIQVSDIFSFLAAWFAGC